MSGRTLMEMVKNSRSEILLESKSQKDENHGENSKKKAKKEEKRFVNDIINTNTLFDEV